MNKIPSKKKWLLFSLMPAIVAVIFFYNYSFSKKENIHAELKIVRQFGKADDAKEEMFGLITSFTVDQHQNLYVADDAFKVVRKFSKEGKLIKNYGNGAGRGPGEFNAIHNICVDTSGNLYVLDKINRSLSVFDSLNNLIKVVKLPFLPAQIISIAPMVVDIMGFPFTYNGNLIYRYDLSKENSDKPVMTYSERLTDSKAMLSVRSGNSGRLVKAPSGDIYYCFFYPYLIYKFSKEGKFLRSFKGGRTLTAPFMDPKSGMVESPAGIKEFVVLPNDTLLLLIYDGSSGKAKQFFDFIDGENGNFLGSVSIEELGINEVRFLRADLHSNIYLDVMNPYPHILKYKLRLSSK